MKGFFLPPSLFFEEARLGIHGGQGWDGQFGCWTGGADAQTGMLHCVPVPSACQSVGAGEDKLPEE